VRFPRGKSEHPLIRSPYRSLSRASETSRRQAFSDRNKLPGRERKGNLMPREASSWPRSLVTSGRPPRQRETHLSHLNLARFLRAMRADPLGRQKQRSLPPASHSASRMALVSFNIPTVRNFRPACRSASILNTRGLANRGPAGEKSIAHSTNARKLITHAHSGSRG